VEETSRSAARSAPDDEHRILVAQAEQRVERHHEAALRLSPPPLPRDGPELLPQSCVDLAGPQDLRA
jgi:hypothetical protein